jgi:hypothetical protein
MLLGQLETTIRMVLLSPLTLVLNVLLLMTLVRIGQIALLAIAMIVKMLERLP